MAGEATSSDEQPTSPSPTLLGTSLEAWVLAFSMPLSQAANMALHPVVEPLRDDLGLAYTELGVVLSAFGVARLLTDLPAGALATRFNPRSVLLAALGLTVVATLGGLLAATAWQVTVARFVNGVGSAIVQAVALSWLVGGAGAARRGRVAALGEAAFGAFALVAPPVVGVLAGALSWRAAFAVAALTAALAFVSVTLWTRPESAAHVFGSPRSRPNEPRGDTAWWDWRLLRAGGALLLAAYLLTFVIFYGRQALLSTLLPIIGAEQLGLSPVHVGLALSLFSALSIAVVLFGGWLGDRVGRRRIAVPGVLALLAGQALLFLIAGEWSFLLVTAAQGAGVLVNPLPPSLVGDALPGPARARGIAVYRLVADAAMVAGPLAMGVALQAGGFDTAKLAVLAPTAILLPALIWLLRARPPRKGP